MSGHAPRQRGLLWPTAFTLVGVTILLTLGTWQWHRMRWKEALIATIEARIAAPPLPLAEALQRVQAGEDLEYTRVAARGRFLPGIERFYWAPERSGPAWHVYAPLDIGDGRVLIVNRGVVTDADRNAARRPEASSSESEIVGLLRKPETRGLFTPDNDVGRNAWYWRDLAGMASSMLGARAGAALPFFLDAERATTPAAPGMPQGGTTRLELPNNHFQYAMTWYGLALTLVGVYVALLLSRRSTPAPTAEGKT